MNRMPQFPMLIVAGALLLVSGGSPLVHAQDDDQMPDQDDLKQGVARISLINGDVSVRRGDSNEWVAGAVNAPLLSEDRIGTAANSRAEVQFDAANVLRIGGNAEIRLVQLEYGRYQMELAHGTVTFSIVRASNANIELDTPSVSVRPSKIGVYRIMVNEAGDTEITVRSGDLEVFTPRGSQWVSAGQSMMARGSNNDPEFQIVKAAPLDEWDRWNENRDRAMQQSVSYRYVPEGVYGVEDLDSSGTWQDVDGYGYSWSPTVVGADWAPYRSGRWVWEDWYGWSWVSYDPWGWAPYHYGRWFYNTGRWWWNPGAFGRRHYWSPALVAWFGFGGRGGVGFGFGNVGWVPLGPREAFNRWWGRNYYGRGSNFNRSINITNVNITNNYRNARFGNGISGMDANDFRGGRFNNVRGFNGSQVREAGLVRGQMPIGPESTHLRFSDRNVANAPRSRENVRFFSRQQPNAPQRLSFNEQRRAFSGENRGVAAGGQDGGMRSNDRPQNGGFRQQNGQQSGGAAQQPNGGFRQQNGGSPQQNDRPQAGARNSDGGQQGGWRRFGQPARTPDAQGADPRAAGRQQQQQGPDRSPAVNDRPGAAQQNRGGWQRFNDNGGNAPNAGGGAANRPPNQRMEQQPQQPQQRNQSPFQQRSMDGGNAPAAQPRNDSPVNRSGWQRFGEPGGAQRVQPQSPVVRERYNAPQRQQQQRSFSMPRQENPRQPSAPSYSAPQRQESPRQYSAPSYSAPRSAPRQDSPRSFSAPQQRSAPSYSAPRSGGGGGGGFSSPRSMGGGSSRPMNSGGGSRQSGGGNQRGGRR